ncbi:hypothetical protein AOQ84DRAFT_276615, partial [Glonium stellatum]
PGKDDEPIRFRIQRYDLSKSPLYQILSCARDEGEDRQAIFVAKDPATSISVQTVLWKALQHLRQPTEEILLWIHQICIDQSDEIHPYLRDLMLSHIQNSASKVIVWLGEADQYTSTASKLVKKLA